MKQFDKIWEESGLGVIDPDDDYGGCLSKEDAEMIFLATMLAAADIADEMVKAPYSIIAEAIREAAE